MTTTATPAKIPAHLLPQEPTGDAFFDRATGCDQALRDRDAAALKALGL